MSPVYERYVPSTYTVDQDPTATLAWLAQRCDRIETAIAILAQGDGEEGQVDDGGGPDVGTPLQGAATVAGAVRQGLSKSNRDEPYDHNVHGPAAGNPDTPEHLRHPIDRGKPTGDRQFLASKVGHYNRRLTANTNVVIADINARNRAAYDPRTGQLRTA